MRGLVLMGGKATRLMPLTRVTSKHLLPVGTIPMGEHPLKTLINAGIRDIMITTSPDQIGAIASYFGSGHEFNCQLTYRVQDKPGGIAEALGLAETFVGRDNVAVILGDNIFEDNIKEDIEFFEGEYGDGNGIRACHLFTKKVRDPQRYGVAETRTNTIINIEEKPKEPKTDMAVTGLYLYSSHVFEIVKTLKPSLRGELEITDVNNYYARCNNATFRELQGYWTDAGQMESYFFANLLIRGLNENYQNGK